MLCFFIIFGYTSIITDILASDFQFKRFLLSSSCLKITRQQCRTKGLIGAVALNHLTSFCIY